MRRIAILVYGTICYLIGAGAYFVGLNGFMANLLGPYSIDKGPVTVFSVAVLVNVGLIVLWGLPHSLMARPGFKQWWTKIVPPAAERSTFMLQAGLLALFLIWQWRPIPITMWHIEHSLVSGPIWALYVLGWSLHSSQHFLSITSS
jgi:methanethiol S-methyltransferase